MVLISTVDLCSHFLAKYPATIIVMVLEIGKKSHKLSSFLIDFQLCRSRDICLTGNNVDVSGAGTCAQHQSLSNPCCF